MKNKDKLRVTEQAHNDMTRTIWMRPSLVGLDGIVLSSRESNLIKPDGSLYGQPDNLCFDPAKKILYQIEYKTRGNKSHAKFQLTRNASWLRNIFPDYRLVNIYMNGFGDVAYFQGDKK